MSGTTVARWQEENQYTACIPAGIAYPTAQGIARTEPVVFADDSGTLRLYRSFGIDTRGQRRNKRPDGQGGYVSAEELTNADLFAISGDLIIVLPSDTSDEQAALVEAAGYVAHRTTPGEATATGIAWANVALGHLAASRGNS